MNMIIFAPKYFKGSLVLGGSCMNHKEHGLVSLECLRGSTGELAGETVEPIEIPNVERVRPSGKAVESAAQEQRDEKIDHWMENIKEFIRNIDVKAL
jgi:hypothetical protein